MIYIGNIRSSLVVRFVRLRIPRPFTSVAEGDYSLALTNTTDLGEMTINPTSVTIDNDYYQVIFILPRGMKDGTYEYAFKKGEDTLSNGIAIVGNFRNDVETVNEEITYKQYGE